jgi:tripartite-type tricarboxylate transporter receptor subunit TctC
MRTRLALVLAIALAALTAPSITNVTRAAEWPTRPIRVIVTLSAGSAIDVIARIVCEQLSAALGQPIVIENRPGASGIIGARAVALANPDGYTLLAHSSALVISPATVANLPYDPIKDFAPIAAMGNLPTVLVVSPSGNIKTVQDLVALGKKRPITFGSIGVGSPIQLAMERFRMSAGIQTKAIPFKGAPEALVEAMTGRIDVYYSPLLPALPLIRDHKLIALAVSSPVRTSTLPDVPTTVEAGYKNSSYRFWEGLFAPAKTPPEIIHKLNTEIEKAMQVPAVRDRLAKLGVQPMPMSAEQFADFVKEELVVNSELAKAAGISPQ